MRITSAIDRPLQDEHVIAVDPPLQPELPGVWRRRINPFLGRALSDKALTAEQEARNGIQRLRGQSVTAGIISGLDVMLEPGALAAPRGEAVMQILPGLALSQAGEDIVIASARRIAIGSLPVYARADQLDAIDSGAPAGGADPDAPEPDPDAPLPAGGVLEGLRPELPRRVGPTLSAILAKNAPATADLPRVAVLIAEPVNATILGRPGDTCPRDPRDDPYDDLQRIDGCRLMLAFWPSEMIAIAGGPDYSMPPMTPSRRNGLAYRVFNVERRMLPGEIHPWEGRGVPLALIGFNDDWTLAFVDRAAVARLGGQPNPRTPLVPRAGTPVLWQARISQFVEHLADLATRDATALRAALRQLPPIGFLPIDVIDLPTRIQHFFPAGHTLSAVPAPVEDLDVLVRDSASLVPISLETPDAVELVVPVPERVYEPGLLETAVVDPAFGRAITRYVADRSNWLTRRELVRRRRDLLIDAATGKRMGWPASDMTPEEALPYPNTRAPLTATRVRRAVAGTSVFGLWMEHAQSSLEIRVDDRIFLWVRVVSAAGLTGFSLCFGGASGDYDVCVYWGSPAGLNLNDGAGDTVEQRRGNVPPTGIWIRLEIPADAPWTLDGAGLGPSVQTSVLMRQNGGTVEWGPLGKVDAEGNETVWIADDAPPGATLFDNRLSQGVHLWPQFPAGSEDPPVEADFGTVEKDGVRTAVAMAAFRARWTDDFLANEFLELNEQGIDGFVAGIQARMKATNDVVDAGFVRARTDIYRVRQFMLGADAASRLVTSPALADLASRDEGARATSTGLADFLKSAYKTDFRRDENAPLEPRMATATATVTVTATATATAGTGTTSAFVRNFNFSAFSLFGSPTVAAAPQVSPSLLAVSAQPVMMNLATTALTSQAGVVAPTIMTFQPATALATSSIAGIRASFSARDFVSRDVRGQLFLPGAVERTASVAERLKPAPAVEAHQAAIAGKLAVINAIAGLLGDPAADIRPKGIVLGDLPAPGFRLKEGVAVAGARKPNTIGDVIADSRKPAAAQEYTDLDQLTQDNARHEADYFRAAVAAIDNTIALLRLVEGRVDFYERMVNDALDVRGQLMDWVAAADARLRTLGVEIEEARHDLAVAKALLAEEQARVDALNARRQAILAQHAKMLVFRRPRRALHTRVVPTAPATAALVEAPVTVCLREHDAVPEEIRDYAALFRDAPVAWFPAVKARMDLLDRLEAARAALYAVRLRAASPLPFLTFAPAATAPRLLGAVYAATAAQRAVLDQRRVAAAAMDLSVITTVDLSIARRAIVEAASMGDLIAGEHNRPTLSRLAATEIESVAQVAGCLHASFSEVPPIVRLGWAEALSEFDRPAPLSRLAGLPDWGDLPLEERRTQQGFVDWLFSRIDRSIPQAEAAMNDLVRICLLMAAHAPVDRIIPARLVAPAPARLGVNLDLAVDIRLARVGMTALIRGADTNPIAHAVIEDLAEGVARARITRTFQPQVATIQTTARIDLTHVLTG
ncbi:MAG: hypothetical protein AB7F35_05025 [Acetobacteraceae bacterium]